MPERPILVFEVNETLLDLDALRPTFDRIFNDPAMRLWFANLITHSEALTLSGVHVSFSDIGGAVLRMLAATRDITISDADSAELTDRFATMPPHPESRRRCASCATIAGVIDVFERRFSVDETARRHKPAPEAYHSVAAALKVDPGDNLPDRVPRLGHDRRSRRRLAGWAHLREGNAPLDVGPQPTYIGKDLDAIADQLIGRYGARGPDRV